jgi:hypothetical protein
VKAVTNCHSLFGFCCIHRGQPDNLFAEPINYSDGNPGSLYLHDPIPPLDGSGSICHRSSAEFME